MSTSNPHTTSFPSAIIYSSTAPFSFAHFMKRLYYPGLPPIAQNIRVLSFYLPNDSMVPSGVLTWLSSNQTPLTDTLSPTLHIASTMCVSLLDSYQHPSAVPVRKWFQVLIHLVRCCENVEMIEVPAEWGDVRWYDGAFPLIDQGSKRQLGNGRWRWGKDWAFVTQQGVDVEAHMEERSLGAE